MNEQRGTLEAFARHFVAALEPLRRAVSDENSFRSLMLRLGWETAGLPPAYTSMGNAIGDAAQAIKALSDDPKPAEIADLLVKTKTAYEKIRSIDTAPPGVDAGAFLAEIGERLFEILLTDYLATQQTAIFNLLSTLNVIEVENIEPTAQQRGYVRTHFKWEEIPKIITDPASLPERVYGWGTPDLRFHLIVQHVGEMLTGLGFPIFTGPADDLLADAYHDTDNGLDETAWLLKVPFYYITIANKNLEAAFTLMELKSETGKLPGVIIQPEIPEEFPLKFHIAPTIDLRLLAGTNAASQFGILLRPGEASIKYPFEPGTAPPAVGIGIGFDFNPATPRLLFGAPAATRLEFQGASVDFGTKVKAGDLDILLSAQLKGLALVLAGGESDSFLRSFIGNGDSRIEIPLGIEWSRRDGVHFSGSGAFEVAVHPSLRLGPLAVNEIALRLFVPPDRSADLALSASVGLSGELGPVAFVIDKIGFQIEARFTPGNLGPLDLQPGFKPPNGVGLAIDAEVVHGGGFLSFDTAKGEYSGAMFLEFEGGIAVTALGLITTRLPDGAKGYSLMVIVTAEGFTPIQLGYGFSLTGIGGLVAINRTFDEAALRGGLKNHTLDSVMFPHDPIRNAPQILSNLNKVFPPANGHHLFGPMVQISWGTPVLITADVGVVLEFGARLRLLILAQVVAILPKPENDLVRLQMDAVGVLDFDQGTAALDATLYDSRLLQKFALTGDMAMRMNWEGSPNFALAIGGLHPAFNPPPNFPKLDRIAINLSAGDNPRIRCEAYFALTSNTVQFGARLELYASASGFSIQGETGFDVLIQLDPFYFLAEFYAQVQLKHGSTNLFKVRVEGALAGPRPLHIKGKATFEVLWWDVSIRIDRTLVEGEKPPAAATHRRAAAAKRSVGQCRQLGGSASRRPAQDGYLARNTGCGNRRITPSARYLDCQTECRAVGHRYFQVRPGRPRRRAPLHDQQCQPGRTERDDTSGEGLLRSGAVLRDER